MYTSFTEWDKGLYLAHHGIKGQKWGQRRFQNPDGSLTAAGRAHYGVAEGGNKKLARLYNRESRKLEKLRKRASTKEQQAIAAKYDKRAKVAARIAAGLGIEAIGYHISNTKSAYDVYKNNAIKANNDIFDKVNWEHRNASRRGDHDYATNETLLNSARFRSKEANDQIRKIKESRGFGTVPASTTTKALAGGAALVGGYAAYAKIRSGIAKYRSTGKGHEKQMAKYRVQTEKMLKQFSGTPFSQLVGKRPQKSSNKNFKGSDKKAARDYDRQVKKR